jgi:DNA phosphorothioation-dependent restriction protein DptG
LKKKKAGKGGKTMKILGLNIGKKWISSSKDVLAVDETREKQQAMCVLISVLSQMVDVTNQEIKGRCKTGYRIGIGLGIPKSRVSSDAHRLQYELENDYPFIHSWTDKDRESVSPEESLQKIRDLTNEAFGFNVMGMMDAYFGVGNSMPQSGPRYGMTRKEREANNKPKVKKLPEGYYLLPPKPCNDSEKEMEDE